MTLSPLPSPRHAPTHPPRIFTALALCAAVGLSASARADDFGVGAGGDGLLNVDAAATLVNAHSPVVAAAALGASAIEVGDGSQFDVGDIVFIWQTILAPRPTSGDQAAVALSEDGLGGYAFHRIQAIATNTLTFETPLERAFEAVGAQVVQAPEYTSVLVQPGASIVAPDWDGFSGGVIVFFASTGVFVDGVIDASGSGLRGGIEHNNIFFASDRSDAIPDSEAHYIGLLCPEEDLDYPDVEGNPNVPDFTLYGARKGEGHSPAFGLDENGRGNLGVGGGGGNCLNAGGGGGGNGGIGGLGGDSETVFDSVPFNAGLGRPVGGYGGAPTTSVTPGLLSFGGGGGGGEGNNFTLTAGANGGGVIFLRAVEVSGLGSILANGGEAEDVFVANPGVGGDDFSDGAGGGGGGGTIRLDTTDAIAVDLVAAAGGFGGDAPHYPGYGLYGPGGGGGGGRIITRNAVDGDVDVTAGFPGLTDAGDGTCAMVDVELLCGLGPEFSCGNGEFFCAGDAGICQNGVCYAVEDRCGGLSVGASCDINDPHGAESGGAGDYAIMCGDGIQQDHETCDDGNRNSNDGCSDECVPDEVIDSGPPPVDAGPDAGAEPEGDAGGEPDDDAGVEPENDAGNEPENDAGNEPEGDAGNEPAVDGGAEPEVDGGAEPSPEVDGGTIEPPPVCACDETNSDDVGGAWALLAVAGLALIRRRRRTT